MGVFDRLFGRGRELRAARRAELRGDLAGAAEMFGLASAPEEAARVMLLRGEAETDLRARLGHFTQAVATAPVGHPIRDEARRKRAALVVAQHEAGAVGQAARQELRAAAKELLDVGDAAAAAQAFKLAGDSEGEAAALQQAGNVESLEALLNERQAAERADRARNEVHQEVELLLTSGRRREALDSIARWVASHDDAPLRDRARSVDARRAIGPIVELALHAKPVRLVLGDDVVIGRTEGALRVASAAVSHRHLRVMREGERVVLRDLDTRNVTQLRGIDARGAVPVPPEGVELMLGKQVRVRVSPAEQPEGAVRIELGGVAYVAPLGRLHVPGASWELVLGAADWLELVTHGHAAYLGGVSVADRTTLLVGDVLTTERSGAEVLRVVAREP